MTRGHLAQQVRVVDVLQALWQLRCFLGKAKGLRMGGRRDEWRAESWGGPLRLRSVRYGVWLGEGRKFVFFFLLFLFLTLTFFCFLLPTEETNAPPCIFRPPKFLREPVNGTTTERAIHVLDTQTS